MWKYFLFAVLCISCGMEVTRADYCPRPCPDKVEIIGTFDVPTARGQGMALQIARPYLGFVKAVKLRHLVFEIEVVITDFLATCDDCQELNDECLIGFVLPIDFPLGPTLVKVITTEDKARFVINVVEPAFGNRQCDTKCPSGACILCVPPTFIACAQCF